MNHLLRQMRPDELTEVCKKLSLMDPWLKLGITSARLQEPYTADPSRQWFVIESGGVLQGCIVLRKRGAIEHLEKLRDGFLVICAIREKDEKLILGPAAYVHNLAIFPGNQGKGLGAKLLKFAEDEAAGATHIFLCVSDFNTAAQAFYNKHGYSHITTIPDCIKPGFDELLFARRLNTKY